MQQIERLIARLVEVIEDEPCQTIMITIEMDSCRVPVQWQVTQIFQKEGNQTYKEYLQKIEKGV
jgi:hypothetical protein